MRSILAALAIAGCAGLPPSHETVGQLAPTGTLRTGHLVANPILVTRDARSNELSGITIDLARALAREANVGLDPIGYENLSAAFQAAARGEIDVLFLANDPSRAGQVDFAATYMEVTVTYLVRADSPIHSISDADRPGMRIAVGERNAADLYLGRNLESARLVRVPYGVDHLIESVTSASADAVAGNVPELLQVARHVPGMRLVEGRITAIPHAIAIPKGRPRALEFVRQFSEEAKASGLVDEAIVRSGVAGVTRAR
jgi:polar amino acid transport system substrate-binding protein